MFSEVVYLHISICIRTVCTCVRIGCAPQIADQSSCVAVACYAAADPVFRPCWLVFTCLLSYDEKSRDRRCVQTGGAISRHFSSQTLLNKDRQSCESWRDAELGVRAVCAVGDTTDEDRWVDLLSCSPNCDTAKSCLMNDTLTTFSSSSDCYDDWRRPSPTVRRPSNDAISPFCRCHLCSCYNVSAAQRLLLAASYMFLVTFSVLYYVTDFFLLYLLVFPYAINNYRSTPVTKGIFWFQSCLLINSRFLHRLTAE